MARDEQIFLQTQAIVKELLAPGTYNPSTILVVSCSISRVEGRREDTTGDPHLAKIICQAIWESCPPEIHIAVQCCEHLNRALIVERELMVEKGLTEVSVVPVPEAGGTFAAVAYQHFFKNPVVVESIRADLGLDIGLTMIGMHLKPVVKPLLLTNEYIGGARVVAARTRPKLVGGARAKYPGSEN